MDFINKDNYNQFEIVMQNHSSYDLEHNDCIKKTFIYVVNHNMIFKGNLGEFIAKYKIKYPDGCKVDSNGKIILEH